MQTNQNSNELSTPFNPEAEREILGSLLLNNDFLGVCQDFLFAEHFYEPLHQRIYAAICDCFCVGDVANPLTLKAKFDADGALSDIGGAKYLTKLVALCSTQFSVQDAAKEIYRCWQKRQISAWCEEAIAQAKDPDSALEPEEVGASLVAKISGMEQKESRRKVISGGDLALEIYNELDAVTSRFNSGLPRLDRAMQGGFYAGYTYGFGGRKKTGKTVLAGTLSYNLDMAGVKHLFVCGEMGAKQIHKRMIARFAESSDYAFRLQNMQKADFRQKVGEYAAQHGKNIVFQNAPGLTLDDLKRYCSRAVLRDKVSGIIIDYWQLVGGKSQRESDAKHLDNVAQWIADFGREHNVFMVVFSQMNQDGNTRGGEGLRNACDQFYEIRRQEFEGKDSDKSMLYMEMKETRYTEWGDVGSNEDPAYDISSAPHFIEREADAATYSVYR